MLIGKMMEVQKHSKFARKFCLPPFLGQRDSWIIIMRYLQNYFDSRSHLRLSSSGVSLPWTGADCRKEEASTYFSFEFSPCSGAASTSRILFWVSIGKRWRGILTHCICCTFFVSNLLSIIFIPVTGFKIFSVREKQLRRKLTAERNCCQVNLDLE